MQLELSKYLLEWIVFFFSEMSPKDVMLNEPARLRDFFF